MDGIKNVRILAWRQENVIMKKSADVLRGHRPAAQTIYLRQEVQS